MALQIIQTIFLLLLFMGISNIWFDDPMVGYPSIEIIYIV